ncbi:putative ABC transport system permease protein [Streptosporangium becharense]|uniref:Putative ABC transport system permease protein n=1 Tax=Streptosporangium becharense TaxID=1816182 RepID=A0A7W9IF17_9ACTN|nr:ABC transporter permease [Streptosporangium becharense]MBB2909557.1 putative ABC transport system permease protein [Streptosporangium becharense]MBB5819487.1 putative ABC transport system permease protein [Streptosporangium becharense]
MSDIDLSPATAVVVVLLALGAAAVARSGRLGHAPAVLTASLRAAVQLGVVSLIIVWAVDRPFAVALFILVMYGVASVTAGRRITPGPAGRWAAVPVAAGAVPVLALLFGTGTVPLRGITLIPVTGILLGGCLTATALAGRRALDELAQRRGEVEAALALGFSDRDAALEVCRPPASQALVPALDQTGTVGLVTLPGAFVGMLLGGAGPLHAGVVQLVVLIALLAAEAVAVVVTIELAARGRFGTRPGAR